MDVDEIITKYTYNKEVFPFLVNDDFECQNYEYMIKQYYKYFDEGYEIILKNNDNKLKIKYFKECTDLLNVIKRKLKSNNITLKSEKYVIILVRILIDYRLRFLDHYFSEVLDLDEHTLLFEYSVINTSW